MSDLKDQILYKTCGLNKTLNVSFKTTSQVTKPFNRGPSLCSYEETAKSQFCFCLTDEFCEEYPHNLIPTPGYWIECSRQKINMPNQLSLWDESDSDHEDNDKYGARGGGGMIGSGNSEAHLERGCSDLYEDDEDSEAAPRYRSSSARQR